MYPVTVEDKSATDKPATDKPAKDKPALRRKKTYQMYSDSESKSESSSSGLGSIPVKYKQVLLPGDHRGCALLSPTPWGN